MAFKKGGVKIGGVEEAAEMLARLEPSKRNSLLEQIARSDPEMAEHLKKKMVVFDDLQYLTVSMLQELLREITLSDLGLALRVAGPQVKDFFLTNVSSRMKSEIEDVLNGPPQAVSTVQEAMEKIMTIVRAKMEKGQIIIDKSGSETFV